MRTLFILSLVLIQSAFANDKDFSQCKVQKTTKLRTTDSVIAKGSIGVTRDGKHVGMKEILSDAMIYFKAPNGEVSQSYQWMYNPINKVENREDKYLATSFGEDVIVTIGAPEDEEGKVTVRYNGTKSGNYLTLKCE